ncbi:MAG: hypothetical protein WCT53_04960 [Candidatus Gracilibacteria bacterium]
MITSQSFFKASNLYFALAFFIIFGAVGFGWLKWDELQAQNQATVNNSSVRVKLADSLAKAETDYKSFSQKRVQKQVDFSKQIREILPLDENYTDLTRKFDDFFAENDKQGNPLSQSSLRFGKGAPVADMPGISALPISMSIESSRDNFFKFLDFVNQSGVLSTGRRLMEIKSIQLNFPGDGELVQDPSQKIDFTVEMVAYYQTPKK